MTNPIKAVGSVSGNQPRVASIDEDAGETFLLGTPVMLNGSGDVIAWDGVTIGNGIAGISVIDAGNLTTTGTPKTLTFGSVQNEASAVNIPRGAPLSTGQTLFEVANTDTIFSGQVGPSQLASDIVIGHNYGMTIDTDGHWYVDTSINNQPTSVVLAIGIDQYDTRGVRFVFLIDVCQVVA